MVDNSPYKDLKKVKGTYEVYIDRSRYHWFLLLKLKESDLPFISLEASTPDFCAFSHEMHVCTAEVGSEIVRCGEIDDLLSAIVDVAGKILKKMDSYSLWKNNCQHFCNNFLKHYCFEVYPVTLGKEVTAILGKEPIEEDRLRQLFTTLAVGPSSVVTTSVASLVNCLVGAKRSELRIVRYHGVSD